MLNPMLKKNNYPLSSKFIYTPENVQGIKHIKIAVAERYQLFLRLLYKFIEDYYRALLVQEDFILSMDEQNILSKGMLSFVADYQKIAFEMFLNCTSLSYIKHIREKDHLDAINAEVASNFAYQVCKIDPKVKKVPEFDDASISVIYAVVSLFINDVSLSAQHKQVMANFLRGNHLFINKVFNYSDLVEENKNMYAGYTEHAGLSDVKVITVKKTVLEVLNIINGDNPKLKNLCKDIFQLHDPDILNDYYQKIKLRVKTLVSSLEKAHSTYKNNKTNYSTLVDNEDKERELKMNQLKYLHFIRDSKLSVVIEFLLILAYKVFSSYVSADEVESFFNKSSAQQKQANKKLPFAKLSYTNLCAMKKIMIQKGLINKVSGQSPNDDLNYILNVVYPLLVLGHDHKLLTSFYNHSFETGNRYELRANINDVNNNAEGVKDNVNARNYLSLLNMGNTLFQMYNNDVFNVNIYKISSNSDHSPFLTIKEYKLNNAEESKHLAQVFKHSPYLTPSLMPLLGTWVNSIKNSQAYMPSTSCFKVNSAFNEVKVKKWLNNAEPLKQKLIESGLLDQLKRKLAAPDNDSYNSDFQESVCNPLIKHFIESDNAPQYLSAEMLDAAHGNRAVSVNGLCYFASEYPLFQNNFIIASDTFIPDSISTFSTISDEDFLKNLEIMERLVINHRGVDEVNNPSGIVTYEHLYQLILLVSYIFEVKFPENCGGKLNINFSKNKIVVDKPRTLNYAFFYDFRARLYDESPVSKTETALGRGLWGSGGYILNDTLRFRLWSYLISNLGAPKELTTLQLRYDWFFKNFSLEHPEKIIARIHKEVDISVKLRCFCLLDTLLYTPNGSICDLAADADGTASGVQFMSAICGDVKTALACNVLGAPDAVGLDVNVAYKFNYTLDDEFNYKNSPSYDMYDQINAEFRKHLQKKQDILVSENPELLVRLNSKANILKHLEATAGVKAKPVLDLVNPDHISIVKYYAYLLSQLSNKDQINTAKVNLKDVELDVLPYESLLKPLKKSSQGDKVNNYDYKMQYSLISKYIKNSKDSLLQQYKELMDDNKIDYLGNSLIAEDTYNENTKKTIVIYKHPKNNKPLYKKYKDENKVSERSFVKHLQGESLKSYNKTFDKLMIKVNTPDNIMALDSKIKIKDKDKKDNYLSEALSKRLMYYCKFKDKLDSIMRKDPDYKNAKSTVQEEAKLLKAMSTYCYITILLNSGYLCKRTYIKTLALPSFYGQGIPKGIVKLLLFWKENNNFKELKSLTINNFTSDFNFNDSFLYSLSSTFVYAYKAVIKESFPPIHNWFVLNKKFVDFIPLKGGVEFCLDNGDVVIHNEFNVYNFQQGSSKAINNTSSNVTFKVKAKAKYDDLDVLEDSFAVFYQKPVDNSVKVFDKAAEVTAKEDAVNAKASEDAYIAAEVACNAAEVDYKAVEVRYKAAKSASQYADNVASKKIDGANVNESYIQNKKNKKADYDYARSEVKAKRKALKEAEANKEAAKIVYNNNKAVENENVKVVHKPADETVKVAYQYPDQCVNVPDNLLFYRWHYFCTDGYSLPHSLNIPDYNNFFAPNLIHMMDAALIRKLSIHMYFFFGVAVNSCHDAVTISPVYLPYVAALYHAYMLNTCNHFRDKVYPAIMTELITPTYEKRLAFLEFRYRASVACLNQLLLTGKSFNKSNKPLPSKNILYLPLHTDYNKNCNHFKEIHNIAVASLQKNYNAVLNITTQLKPLPVVDESGRAFKVGFGFTTN